MLDKNINEEFKVLHVGWCTQRVVLGEYEDAH